MSIKTIKKDGTNKAKKWRNQIVFFTLAVIFSAIACSIYSHKPQPANTSDPISQNTEQTNTNTTGAVPDIEIPRNTKNSAPTDHPLQPPPQEPKTKNHPPSWDENSPLSNFDFGEEHKKRFSGDVSQLPLLKVAPDGTKTYQGDRTLVIVSPSGEVGFLPEFDD